jgi:hypothetical protein
MKTKFTCVMCWIFGHKFLKRLVFEDGCAKFDDFIFVQNCQRCYIPYVLVYEGVALPKE